MIIETKFMAIDIDEIAGVFRNDNNLLQVFFKNGLRESISYKQKDEMNVDYDKLVSGLKKRKES
jgi:hypothetical protein